jgi:anthranilate synthase/aminodeoxychorismate synthase-like glutamine amidotransferase
MGLTVIIDNYDSFTYNLVQELAELKEDIKVFRNDKITLREIQKLSPQRIIISPGPSTPKNAGISLNVVKHFAGKIPILGVCLGHQCIGEAFGGKIVRAKKIMHGKTSMITHDNKTIFANIPNPFEATRYHSLVIEKQSLPDVLEVSAVSEDGEIMGVRHRKYPIEGVQFHPESILTKHGKEILDNFLRIY